MSKTVVYANVRVAQQFNNGVMMIDLFRSGRTLCWGHHLLLSPAAVTAAGIIEAITVPASAFYYISNKRQSLSVPSWSWPWSTEFLLITQKKNAHKDYTLTESK